MSNIKIDPTKGQISVGVQAKSLQVVSFSISVYASDGNTVLEHYPGDTNTANPFIVKLPKSADNYVGDYIAGTIKLFDPLGAGNAYDIVVFLSQAGVQIIPIISLTGTTTAGVSSFQTIYHIQ